MAIFFLQFDRNVNGETIVASEIIHAFMLFSMALNKNLYLYTMHPHISLSLLSSPLLSLYDFLQWLSLNVQGGKAFIIKLLQEHLCDKRLGMRMTI